MRKFFERFKFYKIEKTIINKISNDDKVLLIIRTDLIGDYIATRHLISALKQSDKYKDYKFVLVLNSFLKDLAMEFDAKYIDEFVWIDRNKIFQKRYRKQLQKLLDTRIYDVVINPQYSRCFISEETTKLVRAKEKICMDGDNYNLSEYSKNIYNLNYTKILKMPKAKESYLNRTNQMLHFLLLEESGVSRPVFELDESKFNVIDFNWNLQYVVIFPFARSSERIFNLQNYLKLAKHIYDKHNIITLICGSKQESTMLDGINCPYIKNICGKYSLAELPYIFSKAKLVMSNDTMALHIAAGANKNVFCFSNGKFIVNKSLHYEEINNEKLYYFDAPYSGVKTICPKYLYDDILDGSYDYDSNYFESSYDINKINLDDTKNLIDISLNSYGRLQ